MKIQIYCRKYFQCVLFYSALPGGGGMRPASVHPNHARVGRVARLTHDTAGWRSAPRAAHPLARRTD
jgi:hypothetical protein